MQRIRSIHSSRLNSNAISKKILNRLLLAEARNRFQEDGTQVETLRAPGLPHSAAYE